MMPLFFYQQVLLVIVIVYHVISNNLVFPYYSCCQLFNHALFRASKKFINKNTNSRMMMLLVLPKLMMIDLRCLFQWINHGDNASRAGVLFSLIQSCSISFNLAVWFFLEWNCDGEMFSRGMKGVFWLLTYLEEVRAVPNEPLVVSLSGNPRKL